MIQHNMLPHLLGLRVGFEDAVEVQQSKHHDAT
jgi:hypothetical protein